MRRKQREIVFIAIMAFCCMSTSLTVSELLFGNLGTFIASLGPFLAGWFIYFRLKKEVHRSLESG